MSWIASGYFEAAGENSATGSVLAANSARIAGVARARLCRARVSVTSLVGSHQPLHNALMTLPCHEQQISFRIYASIRD